MGVVFLLVCKRTKTEACDETGDCGFAGNFRGVGPRIGRLRRLFGGIARLTHRPDDDEIRFFH